MVQIDPSLSLPKAKQPKIRFPGPLLRAEAAVLLPCPRVLLCLWVSPAPALGCPYSKCKSTGPIPTPNKWKANSSPILRNTPTPQFLKICSTSHLKYLKPSSPVLCGSQEKPSLHRHCTELCALHPCYHLNPWLTLKDPHLPHMSHAAIPPTSVSFCGGIGNVFSEFTHFFLRISNQFFFITT